MARLRARSGQGRAALLRRRPHPLSRPAPDTAHQPVHRPLPAHPFPAGRGRIVDRRTRRGGRAVGRAQGDGLDEAAGADPVRATRCCHSPAQLGRGPSNWALSSARTRWGSCSPEGKILLSWRLIHFPLHIIDYVIAHEIAHLKELNHGPRFWATRGAPASRPPAGAGRAPALPRRAPADLNQEPDEDPSHHAAGGQPAALGRFLHQACSA